MGKFTEKRNEIKQSAMTSRKKTFNEAQFNELGTALINDPEYVSETVEVVDGEIVTKTSNPSADFRKAVIGSVAKKAGVDAAEAERLVSEHQFPTLPLYGIVDETMTAYLESGKRYAFQKRNNLQASLIMESVAGEEKETTAPGTNNKGIRITQEHNKIKAQSGCPSHLVTRKKA